jgi:hypothetical protein
VARETDMTGREPVPGELTLAREDLTAGLDGYRRLGIELQAPDMMSDLPSGVRLPATSPRLRLQPRQGQVLIDHDELTEARSGQLVLRLKSPAARGGRRTPLALFGPFRWRPRADQT